MLKRVLRTVWIIAGLSFTLWLYIGFQATGEAEAAALGNDAIDVMPTEGALEFRPRADARPSGLLFLPGGMVEPAAYAPLLSAIATAGYPVRLIYLPMRCACTESQRAELFRRIRHVLDTEPGTRWIIAGHSRGAMLSARFVHENNPALAGLVLIATTHPRDFSLEHIAIPVTKIYGTNDGIAAYDAMQQNKHLLPPNTTWVSIEGGNHVQFGHYRHQLGDGDPAISRARQQAIVRDTLLNLLSAQGNNAGAAASTSATPRAPENIE